MPAIPAPAKVLVTGANGFIAVWVVRTLLERGYSVRGTIREESKGVHLHKLFKDEEENRKFELVVVQDFLAPGAFDVAVKGVDAIEHTASPFHFKADDPNEIIEPAVKGTLGVLESALNHAGPQLKRIVITSSVAAVSASAIVTTFEEVSNSVDTGVLNESNWNETSVAEVREKGRSAGQTGKYLASKSLSEKAAWEFVAKYKSMISWDLVTLCPPYVFGPVLNEVYSPSELGTSSLLFYSALISKTTTSEDLAGAQGYWIDVRDLAEGHVRALEASEAGWQRFILGSGMFIWQDWFDAANEIKIPGFDIPIGAPNRGKDFEYKAVFDSTRACNILGIQFRDKLTTTKDIFDDFKSRGW